MPKIVDNEEYLNTEEVIREFGVSKQTFYSNAKRYLRAYHFDGKRTPWYSKRAVQALASGKPLRRASIAISGMFNDWSAHARSLGFDIQTTDRSTIIGGLPQDLAETFHVPADKLFVKRSRMSWVEGNPICTWDSFFPLEYVNGIIPQIQDGTAHDIVGYIKERHGLILGDVQDIYSVRVTSFEEQSLFQLLNDEPLLILQRMAQTEDQKVILLLQDMQLLGSWFVIRRSEKVHHWDG